MKKRVVVSFVQEDDSSDLPTLSASNKKLVGNALSALGVTHIVFCPGLDSNIGQEVAIVFPPVYLDTTDYKNWDKDEEQ
jgi:hypothetical protein